MLYMFCTLLPTERYSEYQGDMDDEEERRNIQLKAMVTAAQKRRWEKAARLARRTLSDWLRITLDDAAELEISRSDKRKS